MKFEDRVLYYEFPLNETDDEVIDYIRKHKKELSDIPIKTMADELYTVPNTIMRVCKKLGYKGFSELKVLIRKELDEQDNPDIIIEKVPKSISKTVKLINHDKLLEAADRIKKCDRCYFIGVGDSTSSCNAMVRNLECLEKRTKAYSDYHDIDYRAAHCKSNDLFIFISVSGSNERLNEAAKVAKENGAYVIALTHFSRNKLSTIADMILYFWGEPCFVNGYNVTDRLGLDLLLRQLSEVFWRIYYL